MKKHLFLLLLGFFSFQNNFAQQLQSPAEFLGYEIGEQFSRHADVVDYFKHISEKSDLVEYHTYGETYERRPLTYAIVSSKENLQNIEKIRQNHLSAAGLAEGEASSDNAVIWLSYNVHGNEASSTEAAMKTLYAIITRQQDWLENTIIIIDPCLNPDGRDRYVNWYNQVKATPFNTSQTAAEHHEAWPGGRPNHYLFDLNRDWAWATQKETQERLKVYNQWMPHIHVDFHEQGINEPYYFAPAAEPFHEIITPFQREFQTEIGRNHARYFDEEGWLYFTRERFDLLYPSYGDTYPTYMGAIGMTYEQAGHGRAGLGIKTDEGFVLTLKDRVEHHFTTGLSTIEIATQNVDKLNDEFRKFFNNQDLKYQSYALNGSHGKIALLRELLDRHKINYSYAKPGRIRGFNYAENRNSRMNLTENTLVVSTDQPKGKMVEVLFEPITTLADSLTYDITAWSIPYAYGLDAIASTSEIESSEFQEPVNIKNEPDPSGTGYIAHWGSIKDARFLAALLKERIKVRFSEIAFQNAGSEFSPGSLIITKSDNRHNPDFDESVVKIANNYQRGLHPATTGFAESGPDFGSPEIKLINPPHVAVLKGDGVSSLNFGEIWHFFEQNLEYPITPVDIRYFKNVNYAEFDILIIPETKENLLDEESLEKIKSWVRMGGKVIAVGSALSSFAGKKAFDLKENKASEADTLQPGNLIPYNQRERESLKNLITGSIIETKVDNSHPIAFGYKDSYLSLKLSNKSYDFLSKGYNVAYLQEPKIVAGFAGSEAIKNLENSLVFGEERMGKGSFIYLVDNPLFRSFWENGKLFFANSIFFVNNNKSRL